MRKGWWAFWRRKKAEPLVYWSQVSAPSGYPDSLTTEFVRVTVDRRGFAVYHKRRGVEWAVHLEMGWAAVGGMRFDNDSRDPVVALYAVASGGQRRYMMDAKHLSEREWSTLASMVAGASGGRVTVDLGSRGRPRSISD